MEGMRPIVEAILDQALHLAGSDPEVKANTAAMYAALEAAQLDHARYCAIEHAVNVRVALAMQAAFRLGWQWRGNPNVLMEGCAKPTERA